MTASKLVVNVEAQTIRRLLDEAAGLEAAGDHERAERTMHEAKEALAISDVKDPHAEAEQVVPLTAAEKALRAKDDKKDASRIAAEEKATKNRMALIGKLESGKASPAEVQAALAQLLA